MLTERDKIAVAWLEMFRLGTARQIAKIAYDGNLKVCYKRLNVLYQDKLIYKASNALKQGYIYSATRIRTTKQFIHDNIRNELYLKLIEEAEVKDCLVEKVYGSIRPDMVVTCEYGGSFYFFLVEVETNGNHSSINYGKYNEFFLKEWKDYFNVKPLVVYVTDKPIDDSRAKYNYRHIRTDLSNFTDIFR